MSAPAPLFFGEPHARLFGWHHPALGGDRPRGAVVLCPPIGIDYICAYRSWRTLAERIAAAGFDALRLDYPGTGNSMGSPSDPGQVAAWIESIARAVSEARSRSGADAVALVGLRLGATLAASAAQSLPDVTDLVLWDGFRTGRAYVREITALSRFGSAGTEAEDGHLEAAGFLLAKDTAADLAALDLTTLPSASFSRVLVLERTERSSDPKLPAAFTAPGREVSTERVPGTDDMLVAAMTSEIPEQALTTIVHWLERGHPVEAGVSCRARSSRDEPELTANPGWRETPLYFGPAGRLFGVLTEPGGAADPGLPAIVALNTGCIPHFGPHRMYVPLAREWASRGQPVFRFDIGGIGESRPPEGAPERVAYPEHALDDVRAAIAEVRSRTRARDIVLLGMCAGAWHAFRAAREGLDVQGIMAINPPLYLRDGARPNRLEYIDHRELTEYVGALGSREKWLKVLRGQANFRTFARVSGNALLRKIPAAINGVFGPPPNSLGADLEKIVSRGIQANFVFSRGDPGHTYYDMHAQTAARRHRKRLSSVVVNEADHTFQPLRAQQELRTVMERMLQRSSAR